MDYLHLRGTSMKQLFLVFFIFVPICCFSQTDQRINLYNEYFQKQDFTNALSMAESLIASFPDSMEFHREKAKMLAATDQRDAFFQEMKFIRNANNKDNISTFFSALSHDLVKRELRDELRRFYNAAKDTQVLLNWPSFDYEKTIDCKELVQSPSQNQPDLDYSIDKSSDKDPAPDNEFENFVNSHKANLNDAVSQFMIGTRYLEGRGTPKDSKKAFEWFQKAANRGFASAQYNLGLMYDKGEGVSQDDKKAAEWYQKAAVQGDVNAQYNLGVMYDQGIGVSQDYKKAAEWYQKAAESGDASAQNSLGAMYANGEGIPQDYVMAHLYFNLAAAGGDNKALENRNLVAGQMTPVQIEKAQELARNWKPKK